MASKSILLLAIFLLISTKVFSIDGQNKVKTEDLNRVVPFVPLPPIVEGTGSPPPPLLVETPPPPFQSPPFSAPRVKPPPLAPSPAPFLAPPAPIVKSLKDCIPLCSNRCQLHSRKRVCTRACLTCCARCKCVPPGTYGNREKCGKCYTDMLTHGNRNKCP